MQAQRALPATTVPHFRRAKEPNKALTWTTTTTYSRATRTNDNENTRERRCHHLVFGCISRVPLFLSSSHNPFIVFCRDIRIHTYTHTCARAPNPAPTSMEARQPGDRRGNEFPNEAPLALALSTRILLSLSAVFPFNPKEIPS